MKVGNNEANITRILRYVHGKGYKVDEMKNSGFGRIALYFNDYREANRCLKDTRDNSHEKIVNFEIPKRAKTCKGIITGWDIGATLEELVSSMVTTTNIREVERMKRRTVDRTNRKSNGKLTHLISITWEGNELPKEIRIYGAITGLRVKSYVENVLVVIDTVI